MSGTADNVTKKPVVLFTAAHTEKKSLSQLAS